MFKKTITDVTGRSDDDDLAQYAAWYLDGNRPHRFFVPAEGCLRYVEGLRGIVLHRSPPFQVQLFIVDPNKVIPSHHHPNIDSYEVYLQGMLFTHDREIPIFDDNYLKTDDNGICVHQYKIIRVAPEDWHGGVAGPEGGCFMSIQKWLDGKPRGSVGQDWVGERTSHDHDAFDDEEKK